MASAGWAEYPKRHVQPTSVKNSYKDFAQHKYHFSSISSWSVEDEEAEFCYSDFSENSHGCDERYQESGGDFLPNDTCFDSDIVDDSTSGFLKRRSEMTKERRPELLTPLEYKETFAEDCYNSRFVNPPDLIDDREKSQWIETPLEDKETFVEDCFNSQFVNPPDLTDDTENSQWIVIEDDNSSECSPSVSDSQSFSTAAILFNARYEKMLSQFTDSSSPCPMCSKFEEILEIVDDIEEDTTENISFWDKRTTMDDQNDYEDSVTDSIFLDKDQHAWLSTDQFYEFFGFPLHAFHQIITHSHE